MALGSNDVPGIIPCLTTLLCLPWSASHPKVGAFGEKEPLGEREPLVKFNQVPPAAAPAAAPVADAALAPVNAAPTAVETIRF